MKIEMPEGFSEAFKEIDKYGLATIALSFILEKTKLHHFPLKALKGYLENLKISNVADLVFWRSAIFRKSNLSESNYSN